MRRAILQLIETELNILVLREHAKYTGMLLIFDKWSDFVM